MTRPTLAATALAALLLQACEPPGPAPTTLPDLTGMEAPVARKLRNLHRVVARSETAKTLGAFARALHAHALLAHAERAYLAAAGLATDQLAYENLHLAGVAASESDPARALDHLARAARMRPDATATQLLRGRLLESLGHFADAEACYNTSLQHRASSHAHLGVGRSMLARGDARGALHHLDKASALDPAHREVHEARARCLARLGKKQDSQEAARRAGDLARPTPIHDALKARIADENVSSEARLHRGAALAQAGEVARAIETFEGVLEVREDYVEALDYLSLLVEKSDPKRALGYLDRILARQPSYPRALELRARIRLRLKDQAGAQQDLRDLLRVMPDHAWARKQLRR